MYCRRCEQCLTGLLLTNWLYYGPLRGELSLFHIVVDYAPCLYWCACMQTYPIVSIVNAARSAFPKLITRGGARVIAAGWGVHWRASCGLIVPTSLGIIIPRTRSYLAWKTELLQPTRLLLPLLWFPLVLYVSCGAKTQIEYALRPPSVMSRAHINKIINCIISWC